MAQQKIQSNQLTDTGVTPGSYTLANITVDSAGRITLATDGSGLVTPRLTANKILYVRTDGNDNNDGSANDAAHAFLTGTAAYKKACQYQLAGGFNVTIQLGNGSFGTISCQGGPYGSLEGTGNPGTWLSAVIIRGNGAANTALIRTGPSQGNGILIVGSGARITIENMRIGGPTQTLPSNGLCTFDGGILDIGVGIDFGQMGTTPGGRHLLIQELSTLYAYQPYTISGGAAVHLNAWGGGYVEHGAVVTIATGTHNFSTAFVSSEAESFIWSSGSTFTGAGIITGKRFLAYGGVIETDPIDPEFDYFPGNIAGTVEFGGRYNDLLAGKALPLDEIVLGTGTDITSSPNLKYDSNVLRVNTGRINVSDGAFNSPSYSFANNPLTGLFLAGSNILGISIFNTERLRINQNGAIGLSGANYGTSGQVITSGGSTAAPTWTTIIPGGVQPANQIVYGTGTGVSSEANFTYNATTDVLAIAGTAGVIIVPAGTAPLPPYSFTTDPNTGIYSVTADTLGITTGGVERFRINATGSLGIGGANFGTAGQVLTSAGLGAAPTWAASSFNGLANGTAALPGLYFTAATDLGMYRSNTNEMTFVTQGAGRFTISGSGVSATVPISTTNGVTANGFTSSSSYKGIDGTVANPSYIFTNEVNTGLYRINTGTVGLSSLGVERFRVESTGAIGLNGANFGTSGQVLTSSGSANPPTWTTISTGTPAGGSSSQIQYNNSGAFAGDPGLIWDSATDTMTIGTTTLAGTIKAPQGAASSAGVTLTIIAGSGGATTGVGGLLALTGGSGTAAGQRGGSVVITGGTGGPTTGNGGNVTVIGGLPSGTGVRGNVEIGGNAAALATNATSGFVTIPTCAGVPSGTPVNVATGQAAMVFDSTNKNLYIYSGGAWNRIGIAIYG